VVQSYWHDECHLLLVLHRHINLVITRERVEEAQ
jgi:hypothetical protein